MDKPTEAQIKEFWEWCGFKQVSRFGGSLSQATEYLWLYPEDKHYKDLPPIDLNNLFKYAVPKLIPDGSQGGVEFRFYPGGTSCIITSEDEAGFNEIEYFLKDKNNPALALFWAIWEVIHE